VRYLTLAEALTIAEAVTGTSAAVLARASRLDLLDSALHAPQAGFGEVEFYPDFADKAAVLTVRRARFRLPAERKTPTLMAFGVRARGLSSLPTMRAAQTRRMERGWTGPRGPH
jgi:hypothetical protein